MRTGRRQKKNVKKAYLKGSSIKLYHQLMPPEKFNALSDDDRYCFLALGNICNEISWLQRMSFITSKSADRSTEVERSANLMQASFLARLLIGKLYESYVVMRVGTSPIPTFIEKHYDPENPTIGKDKVKEIFEYYETNEWIGLTRNKHGLHYPKLQDVVETLNDTQLVWDVNVYHGKNTSNTFYPAADVLANYAWFKLVNIDEPMEGFNQALKIIQKLSLLTLQTLEQSIGYFIDRELIPLNQNTMIRLRVTESIHEAQLNCFINTDRNMSQA